MTRHRWNYDLENRLAACESPDGNGRTERTCMNEGCGLVRITVHASGGKECWRAWRTQTGHEWQGEKTPPCLGKATPARPEAVAETTAEVIAL